MGTQTIKVAAEESFNGTSVYRVRGLTKTTGISRILRKYSDQWTVLMDSSTLCPVWIEREIEKVILASRVILDRYSLCFYYRKNPRLFQDGFSFAFLKADSVDTVFLREEGPALIQIPKISGRVATPVSKYVEAGGDGIEIYTGIDPFSPKPLSYRTYDRVSCTGRHMGNSISRHDRITAFITGGTSGIGCAYAEGERHRDAGTVHRKTQRHMCPGELRP